MLIFWQYLKQGNERGLYIVGQGSDEANYISGVILSAVSEYSIIPCIGMTSRLTGT
jgi:hypothetical protein